MVAVTNAFSARASTVAGAKVQAKPALALRPFGLARLSAVSPKTLQKVSPAFVASRKAVRCDQRAGQRCSWLADYNRMRQKNSIPFP